MEPDITTNDDELLFELSVQVNEAGPDAPVSRTIADLIVQERGATFGAQAREVLELPEEFRVRLEPWEPHIPAPMDAPVVRRAPEIEPKAQDCEECTAYSWSKGCSSWPW